MVTLRGTNKIGCYTEQECMIEIISIMRSCTEMTYYTVWFLCNWLNFGLTTCTCNSSIVYVLSAVPASRNEYQSIKLQLESENFPGLMPGDPSRSFHHLPIPEQAALEKKRLTGLIEIQLMSCL